MVFSTKTAFKQLNESSRLEYPRFMFKPPLLSHVLPIQMAGDVRVLTVCFLSPFCLDSKLLSCFSASLLFKR